MDGLKSNSPEDRIFLTIDNFRRDMQRTITDFFRIARELRGVKVGQQAHTKLSWPRLMRIARERGLNEVYADANYCNDEADLLAGVISDTACPDIRMKHTNLRMHAPHYISVNIGCGPQALAAANEHKYQSKLIIVPNTPAMSPEACRRVYGKSPAETVLEAGRMAIEAGLDGIMCSALLMEDLCRMERVESPRQRLLKIGTGIRMSGDKDFTVGRHVTPYDALANGADILAIGRSVTAAGNPELQIESIIKSIS